jgi:hypothetical protein
MAIWPIAERGREMEESSAQMAAQDRINSWNLEQAKKKSQKLIDKKYGKK